MAAVYVPYTKSAVKPLLHCMFGAAVVAILSVYSLDIPAVRNIVLHFVPSMVRVVPSVGSIASETKSPEVSETILLAQWLFAPLYLFVWFYSAPPWTRRMRSTVLLGTRSFAPAKRYMALLVGSVFLGAWLLGDLGLIDFPTFYNGKFACPLDQAAPQVKVIYGSPVALAVYAWLGPICEVTVVWMLSMLVVNAKTYAAPANA